MRQIIDFAIVVPTLNEEHYIGTLLDSIISQTVHPKEIVIVDAYSQDGTVKEIKKRQAQLSMLKYYKIPKFTIARQRNFGTSKTKSPHIIFLDADMKMQDVDTIERYIDEINQKKPDIAAAENLPLSSDPRDIIYYKWMHLVNMSIKPFWPVATTMNLYVRRSIFEKVGGFDEHVRIWEDCNLIQRVNKAKGRFIFLQNPKLYTSVRRLQKEGRFKMNIKSFLAFLQIILFGYHDIRVKYDFGHFGKETKSLKRI